jgi:predicted esterase
MIYAFACSIGFALLARGALAAGDAPAVDPREARTGVVCQWHSEDGLKYEYFVPETYDPAKGANLTLVLHGTGLDQRWTFANHPPGQFRAADIVVSPDGTRYMENYKDNEFYGESTDANRFHKLIEELKKVWKVKQTFLYGHSNGSFFVFYYAGAFPDDVDGVCGHASGVWNWTTMSSSGRHQAIGLMHGTDDPLVPYGQSWWGRRVYRETAKYPLVHLRTLFGRGHPPAWPQAELQLAWCEGMTTKDAARMEACLATLADADVALGVDWSSLWQVANRLAQEKTATPEQRARAEKLAAAVDAAATRHVEAIEAAAGKGGALALRQLADTPAVGHLIRFLEEFDGVPALEQWLAKNKTIFKALEKSGEDNEKDWRDELDESPAKAVKAGLDLLETGYTHYETGKIAKRLQKLAKDPSLKLSDAERKRLDTLTSAWASGRESGFAAYEKVNAEVKLSD